MELCTVKLTKLATYHHEMVTTLNITLTDEVADNARAVKQARELTWAQFIELAADELERSDDGTVAEAVSLIQELEKLGTNQSQSNQSKNDEAESLIEEIERLGLEQLEPNQSRNQEDEATTIAEILEKQEQSQPTQIDDDEIKSFREVIESDDTPE